MGSRKKAPDNLTRLLRSELSSFIEIAEILMNLPKDSRDKVIDMIKLLYLDEQQEETTHEKPKDTNRSRT